MHARLVVVLEEGRQGKGEHVCLEERKMWRVIVWFECACARKKKKKKKKVHLSACA